MWFIVDNKMPEPAKDRLRSFGEVFELATSGITYESISGHPDVFICQPVETGRRSVTGSRRPASSSRLIVSPSLPSGFLSGLNELDVICQAGELPTGPSYPSSSAYNAVVTDRFVIHNFRHTDPAITRNFDDRELIHVNQGYCRCNILPLKEDHFIVSDEGIYKVLLRYGLDTFLISPERILLHGQKHGFFGGACGLTGNRIFICGNLHRMTGGREAKKYLQSLDYQIVELYDGPITDVGSIICGEIRRDGFSER